MTRIAAYVPGRILDSTGDLPTFLGWMVSTAQRPAAVERNGLTGIEVAGRLDIENTGSVSKTYGATFFFPYSKGRSLGAPSSLVLAYDVIHEHDEGVLDERGYVRDQLTFMKESLSRVVSLSSERLYEEGPLVKLALGL